MPSQPENEPPVLDSVVHSGDPSIIQSTRFGQHVLEELQAMQREFAHEGMQRGLDGRPLPEGTPITFPSLAEAAEAAARAARIERAAARKKSAGEEPEREALEQELEAVVDRHLAALKTDLLALLRKG